VKRADNGFEDREGHQAPITLQALFALRIDCRTGLAGQSAAFDADVQGCKGHLDTGVEKG